MQLRQNRPKSYYVVNGKIDTAYAKKNRFCSGFINLFLFYANFILAINFAYQKLFFTAEIFATYSYHMLFSVCFGLSWTLNSHLRSMFSTHIELDFYLK